ncbi:Seryl-tRNA synthetase [Bifidobacterium magnum]|uniref:Serine--tRNA ligase n=2 Tax=Bifidobacterium magnum TaxID=1692 RepID=A0A087BBH4_9BIFI|nr:Seryl-tRNA synthetase [Bifidobacterium magnum]
MFRKFTVLIIKQFHRSCAYGNVTLPKRCDSRAFAQRTGHKRLSANRITLEPMLDIQFIREHPEIVKDSQRKRGESVELVDEVLRTDEVRRASLKEYEEARAKQKEIGKQVAKAAPEEKAALIAQTKALSEEVSQHKADADAAAGEYTTAMWKLSNIVEPEAPEGGEDDYVVVKKVGTIRDFAAEGFEPKDHLTLGEGVAGIDMKRGVKVSGSRFYFLRGAIARLQIAMLTMAVDQAEEHGFTLAITPTLVRPEIMRGTGFLNSHADEIYRLREPDEDYLVGTSEVALAGMHENEILDLNNGPLRYCGWSSCYRREAGAAGKDTSGIIRVHQFDKVEMFVYAKPEDSYKEHEHLLAMEEEMLGKVEVPYRVIDTAAGDLGSSAARKFDCEAWVPTQGRYRELTSTSNCTQYQARRLNIRERVDGGTEAVATLNGTLATTRWLVAIMENHQQKDGSIVIPKAMRAYMGGKEVIEPTAWEA